MSRIDQLIAELCPEGVEFKTLGDIGTIVRGKRFVKDDIIDAGVPCIHYGEIYTKYGISASSSFSFLSRDRSKGLRFAQPGDVIMASAGETVEDIGKSVAWLGKVPIAIHDACYAFSSTMDSKFVSYFFASRAFREQIRKRISSSKISSISTQNVAKVRIPVPPLEVQREIVKVLDTFTQLEAELEAELEARRQQYHYYRNALLSFADRPEIRWATLGELGQFIRGRRFTKADYVETGIGCIHYGDIYTQYGTTAKNVKTHVRADMGATLRYAKPGDVVITDVGETVQDVGKPVAWLGTDEVAIHDHCYAYRHSMNPTFVAYCMQTTSFIAEKAKYVARTKVNTLLMNGFARIRIPVPPPEEQARIVAILDKFDKLVNDLSSGLPAEIKARRQQYAHYRDRLLSFKEAT